MTHLHRISAAWGLVIVAALASWLDRDEPGRWFFAGAFADTAIEPPTGHFRVEHPAALDDADALAIYERIREDMARVYRMHEDPAAGRHVEWPRYNTAPYRSATHGERFVNNYANAAAHAYGRFEESGTLPEGAVLAKDSFTVTEAGDVFTGPLFLMEKMAEGFDDLGRDWRYTMIMPDGSLFGVTGGEGDERVRFCRDCHVAAGDEHDHLFYLPEHLRVPPAEASTR